MNKELITIIECLSTRIEHKSHSGLVFMQSKPELCRLIRFRKSKGCMNEISCLNCYFSRNMFLDNSYALKLEKVIQLF